MVRLGDALFLVDDLLYNLIRLDFMLNFLSYTMNVVLTLFAVFVLDEVAVIAIRVRVRVRV